MENYRKTRGGSITATLPSKITNFFYPTACLHCGEEQCTDALCPNCFDELLLIDPHLRCIKCFAPADENKCRHKHILGCYVAALFEKEGPAGDLLKLATSKEAYRLIKLFSASMVIQIDRLKWPLPDIVIPVSRYKSLNTLLSVQVAKEYHVPHIQAYKTNRAGDRRALRYRFERYYAEQIADKNIYLIDETITPSRDITHFAKLLYPFSPKKVFSLSVLEIVS